MTNIDVVTCTECGLPIRVLGGAWIHLHIPHGAKHVPSPSVKG